MGETYFIGKVISFFSIKSIWHLRSKKGKSINCSLLGVSTNSFEDNFIKERFEKHFVVSQRNSSAQNTIRGEGGWTWNVKNMGLEYDSFSNMFWSCFFYADARWKPPPNTMYYGLPEQGENCRMYSVSITSFRVCWRVLVYLFSRKVLWTALLTGH